MNAQLLLLSYFLAVLVLAFAWPTFRVYKKTGINPYRLGNTDSAHNFVGKLFRFMLFGIFIAVILYAFSPKLYSYLAPMAWLENPLLKAVGWCLLLISLIWILIAQFNMQESWRIGIDQDHQTMLIRNGLFGISRNPIFLGMRWMLLGFFLILPNALTLTLWLLGDALMQIQVRLEEAYLTQQHGLRYSEYKLQVKRWI